MYVVSEYYSLLVSQDDEEGDKSSDEEFERQLAEAIAVADQEKVEKASKKPKIKQGKGRRARKKRKTVDPHADGYEVRFEWMLLLKFGLELGICVLRYKSAVCCRRTTRTTARCVSREERSCCVTRVRVPTISSVSILSWRRLLRASGAVPTA